jgi:hypothetical protein
MRRLPQSPQQYTEIANERKTTGAVKFYNNAKGYGSSQGVHSEAIERLAVGDGSEPAAD